MISTVGKIEAGNSEESLLLQKIQKINSGVIRELDDEISTKVNTLINGINMYNNTPLTPEILETLLSDGHSFEKTDCERHVNKDGEYVHMLSLLDEKSEFVTYLELKCKPYLESDNNRIHMDSGNNTYDINNDNIINKQLLSVSQYVYLTNEDGTLRGTWTQI